MRYTTIEHLENEIDTIPGELFLAKRVSRTNVKTGNSQLILSTRANLTKKYLSLMKTMDINQVCIADPLTDDITIPDYIEEETLDLFRYHFDRVREIITKIQTDLKDFGHDQQVFNDKFRAATHKLVHLNPSFIKLLDMSETLFKAFAIQYRNAQLPPLVKYIDAATYLHHHALVCAYQATRYLFELGEFQERAKNIFLGALLQDIGVSPVFYTAKTVSTEEERMFREHPRLALMAINEHRDLNPLMGITALNHHRYRNRSGFPRDTKVKNLYTYEEGVHVNGRVICIVNAFATLSLFFTPHKVMDGIAHVFSNFLFDQETAQLLPRVVIPYGAGSNITLNSGEKCVVKEMSGTHICARVILDEKGHRLKEKKDAIIDLSDNKIKGPWYVDKKLRDRVLPQYPLILNSYLTYN